MHTFSNIKNVHNRINYGSRIKIIPRQKKKDKKTKNGRRNTI